MTLTLAQLDKIFDGIPTVLGGYTLSKQRSQQYVNKPSYPVMIFSVVSQGLPVSGSGVRVLGSYLNWSKDIRVEVWGQNCRARLSVIIETKDIRQADELVSLFMTELNASELGINPICDWMQFRGADPPQCLPPYKIGNSTMIQRYAIDFFVEYLFTWKKYYDTIREVSVEIGSEPNTINFYEGRKGILYALDVIILNSEVD
jgi:hypothetical protein